MKITNLYPEYPILEREVTTFLTEWNNDSLFILMQTSGSTGNPKQVKVLKERMRVSARMTGAFFNFRKNDRALLCLSPKYVAGKMMIVRALEFDMELVLGKLDRLPYKDEVSIDFAAMVPMQVEKCLEAGVSFSKLKHLIIGGAPISIDLKKDLCKNGVDAYATFGMTETLSHIALAKINDKILVYKSLPGIRIGVDTRQCLWIRSETLLGETIQTNDVVEIITKNEFIWKGRADFVINSGGIKLHPEEIENKLKETINFDLMVFGEPDKLLGESLSLIIESDKMIDTEVSFLKLEKYQRPKKVYYIKAFVRTETGKINRNKTIEKCS